MSLQIQNNRETYDQIYVKSWEAALVQCDKKLEPVDREKALKLKNANDFRAEIDVLRNEFMDESSVQVILLLYPVVGNYEVFAAFFVSMMDNAVDTSMMWGLLYLVVRLAFESNGMVEKINRILKEISHKLKLLYECSHSLERYDDVKGDTVSINCELINLWLNIIVTLRSHGQGQELADIVTAKSLTELYTEATDNIDSAVKRIEAIAQLAVRQAHAEDMKIFQRVLSLKAISQAQKSTCVALPAAKNKRFFGRSELLKQIDEHLQPPNKDDSLRSVALYGLGGVGKTQIALSYAYQQINSLGAVLWVPAENEVSLRQGFSRIAMSTLKLEGASSQSHEENMICVLDWLETTDASWLLVLDNVEDPLLLDKWWPMARNDGSILITTRHASVAAQPVDEGIEVTEFAVDDGADFLIHLLTKPVKLEFEKQAAKALSEKLCGHALAINQMAALINARRCSISDFLKIYEKYPRTVHRERKSGWRYIGYNHALDTVWDLSFQELDEDAKVCLGMLSFAAAENLPIEFLRASSDSELPVKLGFTRNDYKLGGVIEQLTNTALSDKVRTVRHYLCTALVQAEFLYHSLTADRQESFEHTIHMLRRVFPHRGQARAVESDWPAWRYLLAALSCPYQQIP